MPQPVGFAISTIIGAGHESMNGESPFLTVTQATATFDLYHDYLLHSFP